MSKILGVDPGKRTGLALYDTEARRVLWAKNCTVNKALAILRLGYVPTIEAGSLLCWDHVAIERMASTGKANSDILRTCEASGRMYEAARTGSGDSPPTWLFRREVCKVLHVGGKGKDGQVIDRLCEDHGGSRKAASGTKKAPGPLYGCSCDSWQALAVAVVAKELREREA